MGNEAGTLEILQEAMRRPVDVHLEQPDFDWTQQDTGHLNQVNSMPEGPAEGLQSHLNNHSAEISDIRRCPAMQGLGETAIGAWQERAKELAADSEKFKGMNIGDLFGEQTPQKQDKSAKAENVSEPTAKKIESKPEVVVLAAEAAPVREQLIPTDTTDPRHIPAQISTASLTSNTPIKSVAAKHGQEARTQAPRPLRPKARVLPHEQRKPAPRKPETTQLVDKPVAESTPLQTKEIAVVAAKPDTPHTIEKSVIDPTVNNQVQQETETKITHNELEKPELSMPVVEHITDASVYAPIEDIGLLEQPTVQAHDISAAELNQPPVLFEQSVEIKQKESDLIHELRAAITPSESPAHYSLEFLETKLQVIASEVDALASQLDGNILDEKLVAELIEKVITPGLVTELALDQDSVKKIRHVILRSLQAPAGTKEHPVEASTKMGTHEFKFYQPTHLPTLKAQLYRYQLVSRFTLQRLFATAA